MKIFLNATAHDLTKEQVEAVEKTFGKNIVICNLREDSPELFSELTNCPSDLGDLRKLLEKFIFYINQLNPFAIHLPIGSPAFMFLFSRESYGIISVFSHAEREVIETKKDDGSVVKTSVFKFKKFINV